MLSDIQAPASYTLNFEGQGGPAGHGKGNAQVRLTPNAAGCELAYTVHASVGGKIAQLGQRLIDGVAKSMAEDFFKRFDVQMQQQHPAAYAAEAEKAAHANVQADVQVAKASPADEKSAVPVWIWPVSAAALGLLLWFVINR